MADFDPKAYLAKKMQESQGSASFDPKAYLASKGVAPSAPAAASAPPEDEGAIMSALQGAKTAGEYAARGLDYPGGIARTALATAASLAKHGLEGELKSDVTPADAVAALKGQAPPSSEYMRRMGVDDLGSVTVPILGNQISGRDALGFAADVATDPLTMVSKAVRGADVVGRGAEATGEKLFKSGFKNIDEKLVDKGAKPLSDLALENGIGGSMKNIEKQSGQLLNDVKADRDLAYQVADMAGVKVDPNVALKESLDKAIKMGVDDPSLKEMSKNLQEKLKQYMGQGPVSLERMSKWKSNLYSTMPQSAYDQFGKLKGPVAEFEKTTANAFKQGIEDAASEGVPKLGDKIAQANEKMQTLISAKKPLRQAVKSEARVNAITPVDSMIVGAAGMASHDPYTTMGFLGLKKAADLSKTSAFRTRGGQALMGAGNSGVLTPLTSRSFIDLESPWAKMKRQGEQ